MDITGEILQHSLGMAKAIEARAVIVYADIFSDRKELRGFLQEAEPLRVLLTYRGEAKIDPPPQGAEVIRVPGIHLTRLGQIKIAVLLAFSRGHFQRGDRLVCLSGIAGTRHLDTIVVMEVGEEFELFAATGTDDVTVRVNPEVFERVLDIAASLGYQGREGRPVGTTFVIGNPDDVRTHSRSMVLNPFHGYPPESRNILDPTLEETVKEFAAIDGAFVIRGDGLIEAAGVYLKPEVVGEALPPGLGARHNSAAGITAVTRAVAITVSESTGTVTVFQDGKILIEVERPRTAGPWAPREQRGKGSKKGAEA